MARSRDWEGSRRDIAEDRRMARKNKMTLKEWEASPQDTKHDAGKGYSSGGKVRGMGAAKKGGKYSVC